MNDLEATVNGIGEYIASLSPDVWAVDGNGVVQAHYPVPDVFIGIAGAPSLTVRWDGALDDGAGLESATVPPMLSFEVRVYHPYYGKAGVPQDGYTQAQNAVLAGCSAIYDGLTGEDRSMGGLVLNTVIPSAITGDLVDPDGTAYFGVEMMVNCEIH